MHVAAIDAAVLHLSLNSKESSYPACSMAQQSYRMLSFNAWDLAHRAGVAGLNQHHPSAKALADEELPYDWLGPFIGPSVARLQPLTHAHPGTNQTKIRGVKKTTQHSIELEYACK